MNRTTLTVHSNKVNVSVPPTAHLSWSVSCCTALDRGWPQMTTTVESGTVDWR